MKTILSIFAILFSSQLFAIDNLSQLDHVGTWSSEWTVLEGEKQKLIISSDKSSIFERHFKEGDKIIYKSNDIEYVDDLLIIKYNNDKGQLITKLVISGWHAYGRYSFYGTMYMYNEGIQYNALTVALKRDD